MHLTDLTYITEVCGGDKESIGELIDIFVEQVDEFNGLFAKHYRDAEWRPLAAVAHKAKSSVASLGLAALADDMKRLELVCKQLHRRQLAESGTAETDAAVAQIDRDLSHYQPDMVSWARQSASTETVVRLLDNFGRQTRIAVEELKDKAL